MKEQPCKLMIIGCFDLILLMSIKGHGTSFNIGKTPKTICIDRNVKIIAV